MLQSWGSDFDFLTNFFFFFPKDVGMEALFERCGEGLRELFIDGNNRLTGKIADILCLTPVIN